MATTEEIQAAIADQAAGPRSVTVEGQRVESRDIRELIAADQYFGDSDASGLAHRGLRFSKFIPPGSG